ncbi:MAG: hypothetical protein LQ341_002059 [Variospora aurantia]|nr:MAG: hypothetical protein LQ341_002059 [Variospora aurantia]
MSSSSSHYPNPLKVGVFLVEAGTQFLDIVPVDLLSMLEKHYLNSVAQMAGQPELGANGFEMEYFFINETGKSPNQMTGGAKIEVTHSITTCPPLDILIIGGPMPNYRPSAAVTQFVQTQHKHVRALLTVCTGFLVALHSGIFDGKKATAPQGMLAGLKDEAPQVKWAEKRWVRDGKVWSSGAVTNGLEMMVAFMREEFADRKEAVEMVLQMSDVAIRGEEYKA